MGDYLAHITKDGPGDVGASRGPAREVEAPMQEPTVPSRSQIEHRIERASHTAQLLRDHGHATITDLEVLWAEVDAIRDEVARL